MQGSKHTKKSYFFVIILCVKNAVVVQFHSKLYAVSAQRKYIHMLVSDISYLLLDGYVL